MFKLLATTFIAALITSYVLTALVKRVAKALNIVDEPGERKVHTKPIPLLGGVAVFLTVLIVSLFNLNKIGLVVPIIVGSTILFVMNLIDDIKGLSARLRFIVELVIAGYIIVSGIKVSFLASGILGNIGETLITLIWIVGLTNAFNYLDGLDGLAVGSAIISISFFSFILFKTGQTEIAFFAVIFAAAALGFLPHNFKKAQIFLGDAGSTFLGFTLACVSLTGNWAEDSLVKISIPILILGVPIFDMIFTTIIRIKEKKVQNFTEWLKYGGKDHFHHSLVNIGLSRTGAVLFIWAVTVSLGLSAIMVENDKAWEGVGAIIQSSIIFLIIGVLITIGKHHQSGWSKK